jgi:hypothetical protein
LGGDEADAEDLFQETWMRAARLFPDFKRDAPLFPRGETSNGLYLSTSTRSHRIGTNLPGDSTSIRQSPRCRQGTAAFLIAAFHDQDADRTRSRPGSRPSGATSGRG